MAIETKRLSAAEIEFDSDEDQDALLEQVIAAGNVQLAAELKRARDLGVIDESGSLIDKTLPADMIEGSDADFGG
jgi:hypothetical protein